MSGGQSKLYGTGAVAEKGDVAAAAVLPGGNIVKRSRETSVEIETLRSINAHLVEEVALLKQKEAQAQRLADRDGLTGLYNRRCLLDLLSAALDEARRQKRCVGVLFIDLDGFKGVNDVHGHAVGDRLLMMVAARIAARARTGDVVCRYGGDEFVVALPQIPDTSAAHGVAETIRRRVALPYRINGVEIRIGAAIGIAVYPEDGIATESLLQRADAAMYREKSPQIDRLGGRTNHPAEPARRLDDKLRRRLS